jgi:hypothetical protein
MGTVISTHFPPPVMIDSTALFRWVTHMLCCSCGMCFSTAASSEKDHGSMNLASNTAPVPATMPSRVAAIHGMAECRTRRWTSSTVRPVLRSYQARLREAQDGVLGGRSETGGKIQFALEKAGIEFIDENGGGPRVRLRKRQRGSKA